MEERDQLVKDLYAKYAPSEFSESKLDYVRDNYESAEEFARDFYAKYAPSEFSEDKMVYIRENYLGDVKKKDPSEASTLPLEPTDAAIGDTPRDGVSESDGVTTDTFEVPAEFKPTPIDAQDFNLDLLKQKSDEEVEEMLSNISRSARVANTDISTIRESLKEVDLASKQSQGNLINIQEQIELARTELEARSQQVRTQEEYDEWMRDTENFNEVLVPQYLSAIGEHEQLLAQKEELSLDKVMKLSQTGTLVGGTVKQFQRGVNEIVDGTARLGLIAMRELDKAAYFLTFGLLERSLVGERSEKVQQFVDKIKPTMEAAWLLQGAVMGDYLQTQAALTTPEFVEKEMESVTPTSALFMAAQSAPMMLAGTWGMVAGYTSMGYDMIDNAPGSDELSQQEKDAYALIIGVVSGTLEKAGLQAMLGQGRGRVAQIANRYIADVVSEGGKVSISGLERYALGVARGAGAESFITGTQEGVAMGMETTVNALKDSDIFDPVEMNTFKSRLGHAMAMGAATGGLMTSGFAAVSSNARFNPDVYIQAETVSTLEGMEALTEWADSKIQQGVMTESQKDALLDGTTQFAEVRGRIPDGLNINQRITAHGLIQEKMQLEDEIESKEPALVKQQQERIKQIDAELEQLVSQEVAPEATPETEASEIVTEPPVAEQAATDVGAEEAAPDVSPTEPTTPVSPQETETVTMEAFFENLTQEEIDSINLSKEQAVLLQEQAEAEALAEAEELARQEYESMEADARAEMENETFQAARPKTVLQAAEGGVNDMIAFIEAQQQRIGKFGEGNLGINLPVAVAQAALNASKAALYTAKGTLTAAQLIQKATQAAINSVQQSEWYKNLTEKEQKASLKAATRMFVIRQPRQQAREVTEAEQEGGLTEAGAVKQGWKEYTDAVINPLKKEVRSLRGKLDRLKASNFKAKEFRDKNVRGALDIIKQGVDNKLISRRTYNSLNRRLANARTKGDFNKLFDYIDRAITESGQNAYKQAVKDLVKLTDPKKLTELRQSGQRKGKITNFERIAIQSAHNALKGGDIESITERAQKLQEKAESGVAKEAELAEFVGLLISRNALLNGMRGVNSAIEVIKQIIKDGKSKLIEITKEKAEARRENAERGTDAVLGGQPMPKPGTMAEKAANEASKGFFKRMFQAVDGFFDAQSSLRMLLDKIDRGLRQDGTFGVLDELIYDRVAKARATKDALLLEIEGKIMDAQEKIYGTKNKAAKAVNKRNEQKTIGEFENLYGTKETLILSENEAIHLYNMRKNPNNAATFEAMGWTERMHQAVENSISEQGKRWADWQVNEFYPFMYQKVNPVYRGQNYMDLAFQNKFVPVKRSQVKGAAEEVVGSGPNAFVNNLISVGYGSLNERVASTQPFRLDVSGDAVMYEYAMGMSHYVAFAEAIKEINAITGNAQFRDAVRTKNGSLTLKVLDNFVERLASEGMREVDAAGLFAKWRALHTTSKLAISPLITIKQLSSAPAYAADTGIRNLTEETYNAIFKTPEKTIRDLNRIFRTNAYLRNRYKKGFDRDMMAAMRKNEKQFFSGKRTLMDKLMVNVKYGDAGAIMLGYGVYSYHLKNAPKNLSAAAKEAYAVDKFVEATKMSQQSSNTEDQSFFQAGNAFQKLFTMYKTSPIMYMNQERKAVRDMYRGIQQGNKAQVKNGARRFFIYHALLPSLFQYISNGLPGLLLDWDDEDAGDMMRALALGSLNGVFIAGDIGKWAMDLVAGKPWAHKRPSLTPAFDDLYKVTEAVAKESKAIMESEEVYLDAIMEALGNVALEGGDLTGLPVQRVRKTAEAMMTAEGKWDNYTPNEKTAIILGFSPKQVDYKDKMRQKRGKEQKGRKTSNEWPGLRTVP